MPSVVLTVLETGLIVQHELHHACCLSGEVKTSLEGQELGLVVVLSGKPCRCMCRSTLDTSVALAPGTYHLVVQVQQDGQSRVAYDGQVSVGRQK